MEIVFSGCVEDDIKVFVDILKWLEDGIVNVLEDFYVIFSIGVYSIWIVWLGYILEESDVLDVILDMGEG